MSSANEEFEGRSRVTRGALRRMNSNDSLTDLESRADTPTMKSRAMIKLDTISESALMSSKKGLGAVDSPATRRTRKSSLSVESTDVTSSPLRRTTRAMSSEREITASPLPTRSSRRSAVAESDDDLLLDTITPGKPRATRKNARKSTIISPTIDLIKEEPEEDNQKLEVSKNESEMNADELELRNRSISKSPNVSISPSKGKELARAIEKSASSVCSFEDDEEAQRPAKIFKNLIQGSTDQTVDEGDLSFNGSESDEFEKFSSRTTRKSAQSATFGSVVDRLAKGEEKDESLLLSPSKMVRARRSIHINKSSEEDELKKMMEDFVSDDDVVMMTPKNAKTPKDALKTQTNGTPVRSAKLSGTPQSIEEDLMILETPGSMKKASDTPKGAKNTPKSTQKLPETSKNSQEMPESPESASKTPMSAEKILQTPKSALKTPKNVQKVQITPENAVHTPKSTQIHSEIPKSTGKTQKAAELVATPEVSLTLSQTPQSSQKTPKSAIKTPSKSPKIQNGANVLEESLGADEMDISKENISDMEISFSPSKETKKFKLSPVKTDMKSESIDEVSRRTWSQPIVQKTNEESTKANNKSFSSYLENLEQCRERRKSIASKSPDTSISHSWAQSVRKSAEGTIDGALQETKPEVVKASPRKHEPISSDESDDNYEKNFFVDDEVEVGSEGESITESERNYLKEHEIPEDGESIGSQDSNEFDEDEDEENDSFIDDDEVSVTYDMNSEEEQIEKSPEKVKRKSRIIAISSSEDEKEETAVKMPQKSSQDEMKNSDVSEKQSPEAEPEKSKKRKRMSDINESVVGKKKRVKLNESANESEAIHMEDLSTDQETSEPEPVKVKTKKVKTDGVDIASVIDKCNELMGVFDIEKKKKVAMKREKKALKLAKKKEVLKAAAENLDSSNGENKENAPKKKKKKAKKQKPVEETQQKEDMATSVSKLQEKMERKKQRKLEKKLAKQQQQSENEVVVPSVETENVEKKVKKKEQTIVEPVAVNEKFKKVKKVVEQEPVEVKKKKKVGVEAAVEVPKIQKKKLEELNNQGKDAEPKKSKKKKVEAVVEEHEKKKSKKRKLEESMKAVEEEVVKPKLKKLNILSQIEDPHHNSKNLLLRQESSKNVVEQPFAVPLASQKLKKLIPKALEVEKKKRKKTTKKVYAEPQSSLPQPVWTSAGMFMEESVSAYKFTKTRYVPIQSGKSSTKFGVVVFEGSKKKKQQTQQMSGDFKTQAMQRNKKNRDGSSKNLQDLTGHSRNTM